MKFNDGKTFSAYVRSKLHSSYITVVLCKPVLTEFWTQVNNIIGK